MPAHAIETDDHRPHFDLVELESSRFGLKLLGPGWGLVLCAQPFVVYEFGGGALTWIARAVYLAGLALALAAVLGTAPTPNGPLAGLFRLVGAAALTVGGLAFALRWLAPLFLGGGLGTPVTFVTDGPVPELAVRGTFLLVAWTLWRFCQYRGLSGRGIVWLWIAMAATGALALEFVRPEFAWLWLPVGLAAAFASGRTAREIWIDAVNRNTKQVLEDLGEHPEAQPLTDAAVR